MDPFVEHNRFNLWLQAQAATVVAARTLRAGPAPTSWSGHELVTQSLTIQIEQTLCGPALPAPTVTLEIPIVQGARISGERPGLAAWLTRPGARVVYFLHQGRIGDEDLSAFLATERLIAWLTHQCHGPPPPGTAAVLYRLAQMVEQEETLHDLFAPLEPTVLDVVDAPDQAARLTVVHGQLRLFSGIRFQRVARQRAPDVTLRAPAAQLARALTGEVAWASLPVEGTAPALMAALERASRRIQSNEAFRERIRGAAGLEGWRGAP